MITWPISFLPFAREVADLPVERRPSGRRRRRSRGISLRTARIFGSASAIASTWFGRQPAAGRRDVRRRRPGPALRSSWRLARARSRAVRVASDAAAVVARRASAGAARRSARPSSRRRDRRPARTSEGSARSRRIARAPCRRHRGDSARRRRAPKCRSTSGATSRIAHWAGSRLGQLDAAEDSAPSESRGVQRAVAAAADVRLAAPVEELVAGGGGQQHLAGGRAGQRRPDARERVGVGGGEQARRPATLASSAASAPSTLQRRAARVAQRAARARSAARRARGSR